MNTIKDKPDLSILSDPARSTISNLLFRTMGMPLPSNKSLLVPFS